MPTVLVVDDDVGIRVATSFILDEAGYSVLEAPDGREALDVIHASQEPLIVLLDVKMPVDGYSVIETIEQNASLAGRHRFILFTGLSDPLTVAKTRRIPVLLKPFDIDDLLDLVSQAVESLNL